MNTKIYNDIDNNLLQAIQETEKEIKPIFEQIEQTCEINSLKVIKAFQECNLTEAHFNSSTGYGIDEPGRNKIEEIYAHIFKAEDALVRAQFISGTQALSITLSALLRPGDTMISITGAPYDTLQTVIGCGNEKSKSSLKEYKIKYEQIELKENEFDIEQIQKRLKNKDVKLIDKIEKVIKAIRQVNTEVIIMVDNCYGEFVEEKEPIEIGADIAVRLTNEKLRSRNSNKWSIHSRKKRTCKIMCRKTNSTRNRKRNRTIIKSKHKPIKRTILCTKCSSK